MMNLKSATTSELTALKSSILRELAARRKAERKPKIKRRKVRSFEDCKQAELYAVWRQDHPRCWVCNRSENARPEGWYYPFTVERAHITHDGLGRRIEDVRLIAALCSRCHVDYHSNRIAIETLLALKKLRDPSNYDPEFLQKHSVRRLEFPK